MQTHETFFPYQCGAVFLNFACLLIALCSTWFVISFGFIEEKISLWAILSAPNRVSFPNGFWGKATEFLPHHAQDEIYNGVRSIRFLVLICAALCVVLIGIHFAPRRDRWKQQRALIIVYLFHMTTTCILWFILISHYTAHENLINSFTITYELGFLAFITSTLIIVFLCFWNTYLVFTEERKYEGERRPLEPGQVGYDTFERGYAA